MLSYLFTSAKKDENDLLKENQKLKEKIQELLAENEKLQKDVKNLKIDSSVYRDLMFTKSCNCSSVNPNMYD